MPRFPYNNFPFSFYRNYSRLPSPSYNFSPSHINNNSYYSGNGISNSYSNVSSHLNFSESSNSPTDCYDSEDYRNLKQKNKSNKNTNDYLFDLFGLKIYSDDVLLVSLIYFLYSEGVKDDSLFIVLVLLLLS